MLNKAGYVTKAGCRNLIEQYRPLVEETVRRLAARPTTVGVVLLGGLGLRQYIDEFSDLDIAVFTDCEDETLPPFSFHVVFAGREIEFNLSQHELSTQYYCWEVEKREAYRTGIIAHDPAKIMHSLITSQLAKAEEDFKDHTISALNQAYWKGMRHSISAMRRCFPESAHCLINECINHLLHAAFSINKREVPHEKWQLDYLDNLQMTVPHLKDRIKEALLITSFDLSEFERRLPIVSALLRDLTKLAENAFPGFPNNRYEYWARYISGRQMRSHTEVDHLSDYVSATFTEAELRKLRGALAMALLVAPTHTRRFWDAAYADGLAPREHLDKIEGILQPMKAIHGADRSGNQS